MEASDREGISEFLALAIFIVTIRKMVASLVRVPEIFMFELSMVSDHEGS